MPLVEHLKLPTFSRLREQGHEVLPLDRAVHQDIRELHIGFLNMILQRAAKVIALRCVHGCALRLP